MTNLKHDISVLFEMNKIDYLSADALLCLTTDEHEEAKLLKQKKKAEENLRTLAKLYFRV